MNAITDQAKMAAGPLDLLLQSLQELAAAGRVEIACQLAGHACAALRHDDPKGWQKFNALLHRLTKRQEFGSSAKQVN